MPTWTYSGWPGGGPSSFDEFLIARRLGGAVGLLFGNLLCCGCQEPVSRETPPGAPLGYPSQAHAGAAVRGCLGLPCRVAGRCEDERSRELFGRTALAADAHVNAGLLAAQHRVFTRRCRLVSRETHLGSSSRVEEMAPWLDCLEAGAKGSITQSFVAGVGYGVCIPIERSPLIARVPSQGSLMSVASS